MGKVFLHAQRDARLRHQEKSSKKARCVALILIFNIIKMPYRRSKRGSKAAPVSDLNITHLDLQTLQTIIKHLPCDDDKAGFASAHPSFSSAYRSMVYQASALECFSRLDIASQVLANYENLTSIVLGVDIQYGSPSLRDLKGPSGVTRLRLIFLRDFPSRRSLSALPDNFRNLRSLQLKFDVDGYRGSKEKRNICNGRGKFKCPLLFASLGRAQGEHVIYRRRNSVFNFINQAYL